MRNDVSEALLPFTVLASKATLLQRRGRDYAKEPLVSLANVRLCSVVMASNRMKTQTTVTSRRYGRCAFSRAASAIFLATSAIKMATFQILANRANRFFPYSSLSMLDLCWRVLIHIVLLRSQSGTVCDIGIMTLFYIFISTLFFAVFMIHETAYIITINSSYY